MWNVDPKKMCRKHLLGEHVELHMFVGSINRGINLEGYVKNNLVEPLSIRKRHLELVKELERRGYSHNSALPKIEFKKIKQEFLGQVIDKEKSYQELLNRCSECKKISNK